MALVGEKDVEVPPVQGEVANLQEAVERLMNSLDVLGGRLVSVSREPNPPEDIKESQDVVAEAIPMVGALREIYIRVQRCIQISADINNRLGI